MVHALALAPHSGASGPGSPETHMATTVRIQKGKGDPWDQMASPASRHALDLVAVEAVAAVVEAAQVKARVEMSLLEARTTR